jgi:amino acid permease
MHRRARLIGTVVAAIGVAVFISFAYYVVSTFGDFRKAQMFHERNPGNAMYDLQYFVAASGLVFTIGGAVCGVLLALNGLSWIALGGAVRHLESQRQVGSP